MSDPLIADAVTRASALITVAEETVEAWYVEAEAEVSAILDRALTTAAGAERLLAEARTERARAERLAHEADASRQAVADAKAALIREADDEIVRRRAAADQELTGECERIRDEARAVADAEVDAAQARAGTIVNNAERDATALRAVAAEHVARQMREADQAAAALFAAANSEAAEIVRQAEVNAASLRAEADREAVEVHREAVEVRRAAVLASRRLRLDAERRLDEIENQLRAEDGRRQAEMSRLRAALDRALGSPLAGFHVPTAGFVDLVRLEDDVLAGAELATDELGGDMTSGPLDGPRPFEVPDDLSALTGGPDLARGPSADLPAPAVGSRWRRWLHRV